MSTITLRRASASAVSYMQDLRAKCGIPRDLTPAEAEVMPVLTAAYVTRSINLLKADLEAQRAAAPKTAQTVQVDEGVYEMDGVIYKVKTAVHGSGRLYAQRLHVLGEGKDAEVWYEMERGAITKLRPEHKLTKERAQAFGALYGTCIRCARTLTDEDSISRMMGRTCASKLGW